MLAVRRCLVVDSLLESSDESSLANPSSRTQLPQSMKIMHEIMYKVEVLYVLCVLLMGRQRNQVCVFLVFSDHLFLLFTLRHQYFSPGRFRKLIFY